MKNVPQLALLVLLVAIPLRLGAQTPVARQTVYVAEFTSDTRVEPRLLNSITDEFETLLTAANAYTVLERRRYGALLTEVRREASLTNQPTLVDRLRQQGADAVFFGRVEDDVADGSYVFYITLDKVDRTLVWQGDAALPHGLINNRDSRVMILKKILDGRVSRLAENALPKAVGRFSNSYIPVNSRFQVPNISISIRPSGAVTWDWDSNGGTRRGTRSGTWKEKGNGEGTVLFAGTAAQHGMAFREATTYTAYVEGDTLTMEPEGRASKLVLKRVP